MPSFLALALAAMAASSLAAANPAPDMGRNTRSAGLTTSLRTVRNVKTPIRLLEYGRALTRLGSAIPKGLANTLRRRTTGRFRILFKHICDVD